MTLLYNLLRSKNIKLSILVYPWPGQILHDNEKSLQAKIWKDFCKNKCDNFINIFPTAFNEIENTNRKDFVKKYYINGDIHFNKLGHQMLFQEIKNNLIFEVNNPK